MVVSIVAGALANAPGTQLTPLEMPLNLTLIQRLLLVPDVNGAFWTLAAEMQFYVIVFRVLLLTECGLMDTLPWGLHGVRGVQDAHLVAADTSPIAR